MGGRGRVGCRKMAHIEHSLQKYDKRLIVFICKEMLQVNVKKTSRNMGKHEQEIQTTCKPIKSQLHHNERSRHETGHQTVPCLSTIRVRGYHSDGSLCREEGELALHTIRGLEIGPAPLGGSLTQGLQLKMRVLFDLGIRPLGHTVPVHKDACSRTVPERPYVVTEKGNQPACWDQ